MTQRHYLNCYNGSIYSADHDLARFKPENLMKSRPETKVANLTQVSFLRVFDLYALNKLIIQGGQDILTCGVGTTVSTGMLAAGHVLGRKLIVEAASLKTAAKFTK